MRELDGRKIAFQIKEALIKEVEVMKNKTGKCPHLIVLQYGDDTASKSYAKKIEKNCRSIGIDYEYHHFSKSPKDFINKIKAANENAEITSIMVQQPLPEDLETCLEMIDLHKDVEGITSKSIGKLFLGLETLKPATAEACMEILDYYNVPIKGKKAVVVGTSNIVGKPVAILLEQKKATVTMCHYYTKNLKKELKNADIVISAVGKANLITKEMLNKKAVVIDVGINFVDGEIKGDVDYKGAAKKVEAITPVPGGVGTVTNQILMRNIVKSFKNLHKIN